MGLRRWLFVAWVSALQQIGQAHSLALDPTIVTDLRVIQGKTDAEAKDACAAMCPCRTSLTKHVVTNWFTVGTNLNPNGVSGFTYLCMRQDRRSAVERDGATLFVLQSIAAVEGTCPGSMTTLFEPRPGVSVCLQPISATHALGTGTYVSDVDAVRPNSPTDNSTGWTMLPTSVHTTSADDELVYLRYKRPVRPIIDVRVLSNLASKIGSATACRTHFNASWEPADSGAAQDPKDTAKRSIICLQRTYAPIDGDVERAMAPRVLAEISILSAEGHCDTEFHVLDGRWKLCLSYAEGSSPRFLSQLSLVSTGRRSVPPTMPGFIAASIADLNSGRGNRSTFLMVQEGRADSSPRTIGASSSATSPQSKAPPLREKTPLRARLVAGNDDSGTNHRLAFKILQIADLHITGDPDRYCLNPPIDRSACGMQCTENLTIALLNDLLDEESPDLVVFSGDTITVREWGLKDAALDAALNPVEQRNIPFAWIMGNHDDDYVYRRHEIMDKLLQRQLAYVESGPPTIQGVGNYDLNIKPPSNTTWEHDDETIFRIYLLDSNKKRNTTLFPDIDSTYDWIRQDQIEFYRNLSIGHKAEAPDNSAVPAIMFFHIPIPEYASAGSIFSRHGAKNEKTEGPGYNSHLLKAVSELGDVKATFVGHDHTNEYCYKTHGVQLCYGGGTGFGAAIGNSYVARRARVIEWTISSDRKREIRSWKRHFGAKFGTRQLEEVLFSEA